MTKPKKINNKYKKVIRLSKFIIHILYLISYEKKYSKTEFHYYYNYISYKFEDNLDNLPFCYSFE